MIFSWFFCGKLFRMEKIFFTNYSTEEFRNLIQTCLENLHLKNQPNPQDEFSDTLLDTKEVARMINYKETSLYGLVRKRKIPFNKMEGKLLFSKKEILNWISESKRENK
jgi:predicted DNA-binding transcriptional regulator AlpA